MLWQISVSSDRQGQKIIPIFISDDFILRPMAGMKIWNAILDDSSIITAVVGDKVNNATWQKLQSASQDFAYDTFLSLKSEVEHRNEENHRKYLYALSLRLEAAQNIGIENIRHHRVSVLKHEKAEMEGSYHMGKSICPYFSLVLMVYLE